MSGIRFMGLPDMAASAPHASAFTFPHRPDELISLTSYAVFASLICAALSLRSIRAGLPAVRQIKTTFLYNPIISSGMI